MDLRTAGTDLPPEKPSAATSTCAPRKRIFFIEGNISSGKTTVLENLRAQGYAVFEEPLEEWQRNYIHGGKNILELFYEDKRTWGFKFEIVSAMTRYKQLRKALGSPADVVFIERSLLTDRHVFALSLYRGGFFETLDWQIYNEWHELFVELVDSVAKYTAEYVYIRAQPNTCHERGLGRARREEDGVAPDYFRELHEHHEEWMHGISGRKVHIIDGEGTPEAILSQVSQIIK